MYRTPSGIRRLRGAEASLVARGIDEAWHIFAETDLPDWDSDVASFDRLQPGQKLSLLSRVTRALFTDEAEPNLTWAIEATVAAIFGEIATCLLYEIATANDSDGPPRPAFCDLTWWRKTVRDCFPSRARDIPPPHHDNIDDWLFLVDCLQDEINWDSDFEDEDLYVDLAPGDSARLKRRMSVADDYFDEVPEDLARDQWQSHLDHIAELIRPYSANPTATRLP